MAGLEVGIHFHSNLLTPISLRSTLHTRLYTRPLRQIATMDSLRLICDKEIPIEIQKIDSFTTSYCQSLDSLKLKVEQTVQNHEKLGKLKSSLREAEDEFVKVLGVKTRKEAQLMTMRDSLSAARARIEEVKRNLQALKDRKDECAAIVSEHSLAFAEKGNNEVNEEVKEAIQWYNSVLGLRIEGGRGVKFIFNNINIKNPYEEYSFTIRHDDDMYTLLACDPQVNGIKELIHELNKTNGLFKFVRAMRQKFVETASIGVTPQSICLHQESVTTISISAPVSSVSTDGSETPAKKFENSVDEGKRLRKKANHGKGIDQPNLSPLSIRRSPRFRRTAAPK